MTLLQEILGFAAETDYLLPLDADDMIASTFIEKPLGSTDTMRLVLFVPG